MVSRAESRAEHVERINEQLDEMGVALRKAEIMKRRTFFAIGCLIGLVLMLARCVYGAP